MLLAWNLRASGSRRSLTQKVSLALTLAKVTSMAHQYSDRWTPTPLAALAMLLALLLAVGCDSSQATTSNLPANVAAQPAQLPLDQDLRDQLDRVIASAGSRQLDPKVQSAWQIVHGLLAFGPELKLSVNGEPTPALEWLLSGGALKGWVMMPGEKGLDSLLEAGSKTGQGHEDQWLGYLSQAGVPLDQELLVGGNTYTVADLVTQAQWDVREGMEATWTLMALSAYLPQDSQWPAKDGTTWNLERIVAMEAAQPLEGSACGGSHRLYALATAINTHQAQGGELTGGWKVAEDYIQTAIAKAKDLQQPDGAFSTNYFSRSGNAVDLDIRISTTGHVLEFLMTALADAEIREPWVTRSVVNLAELLEATQDVDLECGGLYHAVRGLNLYRERRFGPPQLAAESESADEVPQTPAAGTAD